MTDYANKKMKLPNLLYLTAFIMSPILAYADISNDMYSIANLLARQPNQTPCATPIFTKALVDNAAMIANPDEADSTDIDTWTRYSFSQKDVLTAVLNCPELQNLDDNETIVFETISYTFPNGRKIDVNYETQKKVLLQKLTLADKRPLPNELVSPDLYSDSLDGNIWVNVDPAWYAILVAEHGTLDEYVGHGKNNVVALRYIEDNIKQLYPRDHALGRHAQCTSKTAIAGDTDIINRAVTMTVGGPTSSYTPETDEEQAQAKKAKSNDYYVMGDKDLGWIQWAEIGTDIVLTVVTWGGYEVVKGLVTAARGTRTYMNIQKTLKTLRSSRAVVRWVNISNDAQNVEQAIKSLDKIEDSVKAIETFGTKSASSVESLTRKLGLLKSRNANAATIRSVEQELEFAKKQAEIAREAAQTARDIKNIETTLKTGKDLSPAKLKRLQELEQQIKRLDSQLHGSPLKSKEAENLRRQIKTLQQEQTTITKQTKLTAQETKQLEQTAEELKSTYSKQLASLKTNHADEIAKLEKLDDIKTYKELSKNKRELAHTLYLLRQGKQALRAKRGLLPVRAFKAAKSLRTGLQSAKKLNKSTKLARANISGLSGKINDWLFHSTMQNIKALSAVPANLMALNMIVKIAGDMYDHTDTSTTKYTNNIDMKPYLLLGADNLDGFENVVNYGMWLFWAGSSTSYSDDDAAFLEAMDFAEKFHQDITELQDELDLMACDVDIYVVRPIIRNPGTDTQELYYLFMNDTPWTTHGYNTPENSDNTPTTSSHTPESAPGTQQHTITYIEPPYDGTIIGKPCTPPSTQTGVFTNEILTTGRYANYPAFEKAMITKFRTEGGCGEHPSDAGGYTCYGVSSRYFPQVRNPNFSRADAEDIAFNHYYKKYKLDKLPDAISGDVLMAMWGMGRDKSIGLLQDILGVPHTNIVDDATITAARNYTGNLRTEFLNAREKMFRASQPEFRQGLLNALVLYRANGCHTIAQENNQ